jgi:hypothetical protein
MKRDIEKRCFADAMKKNPMKQASSKGIVRSMGFLSIVRNYYRWEELAFLHSTEKKT